MTTQSTPTTTLTPAERQALRVVRKHYRESRDIFSDKELRALSFIRWLYETGRIES